jgi:hypothetical protein
VLNTLCPTLVQGLTNLLVLGGGGGTDKCFPALVKCAVQRSLTAGTTSGQCLTDRVVRWLWAQLDTTNVMESGCWDTMSQWSQQKPNGNRPLHNTYCRTYCSFNTIYITCKNVEIFKKRFFLKKKIVWRKQKNILEYLRMSFLTWNLQNYLIIWQTCIEVIFIYCRTKAKGWRYMKTFLH